MNKILVSMMLLAGTLISCQNGQQTKQEPAAETNDSAEVATVLTPCNVKVGDVVFDYTRYGADTLSSVNEDGSMTIRCSEGKDMFCDPNDGKLTNNTLPLLLKKIDNTKPFTIVAKVTPEFHKESLYNAGDLIVYANEMLWQKYCFEQDEYGNHRLVTVRNQETSDDNNHDKQSSNTVYMKISSDTHTIASYYSTDKKEWHMVRLYKNYYPATLYIGIASQCPVKGQCTTTFEEISIDTNNVSDFRMGE